MKTKRYDEFQTAKRNKIAMHTLILLFIMVWLNGFFKLSYGEWAPPMLEMYVLIFIPVMYMTNRLIIENAYLSRTDYPLLIIILFGLASVLSIFATVPSMIDGRFQLVEGKQLSDQTGSLLMMIFSCAITISLAMRLYVNHKINKQSD